jgi:5-methylcytosine-specific restriction endonuclease McrA
MHTGKIISRKEAKALGLKRYRTGRPCLRGHLDERRVRRGDCVACEAARGVTPKRKSYKLTYNETPAGKAANRASIAKWHKANPGRGNAHLAMSRAKQLGLKCSCCKTKDFFPIYRAANLIDREVDHRIPKHLGGLHCLKNLQILTKADHREKNQLELAALRASRQHEVVTELRMAA